MLNDATCEVPRERATGIEPAFSAWEAHQRALRDLRISGKVQLNLISHATAGIRCWSLFVVACCTKWVRNGLLHAVARMDRMFSAMQAENAA